MKNGGKAWALPPFKTVVGKFPAKSSEGFQITSRLFAVTAGFQLVADFLIVVKAAKACTLDRRDVYEHVRAAIVGLNKAEAFSCVEPFYGAIGHPFSPLLIRPRYAAAWCSAVSISNRQAA